MEGPREQVPCSPPCPISLRPTPWEVFQDPSTRPPSTRIEGGLDSHTK